MMIPHVVIKTECAWLIMRSLASLAEAISQARVFKSRFGLVLDWACFIHRGNGRFRKHNYFLGPPSIALSNSKMFSGTSLGSLKGILEPFGTPWEIPGASWIPPGAILGWKYSNKVIVLNTSIHINSHSIFDIYIYIKIYIYYYILYLIYIYI